MQSTYHILLCTAKKNVLLALFISFHEKKKKKKILAIAEIFSKNPPIAGFLKKITPIAAFF